jgi:hypothetical protein
MKQSQRNMIVTTEQQGRIDPINKHRNLAEKRKDTRVSPPIVANKESK